jgi:hypothetical protein
LFCSILIVSVLTSRASEATKAHWRHEGYFYSPSLHPEIAVIHEQLSLHAEENDIPKVLSQLEGPVAGKYIQFHRSVDFKKIYVGTCSAKFCCTISRSLVSS